MNGFSFNMVTINLFRFVIQSLMSKDDKSSSWEEIGIQSLRNDIIYLAPALG